MSILQFNAKNCKNCYKCVRYCPVKAIEIKDHVARIIENDCILCGTCVTVCPQNAKEDIPDIGAITECLIGGEQVIAYARLKTLMNIRTGNAPDAELITTYRKNAIVEVLQECGNGWLRIRCPESRTGYAYVSNEEGQYAFVGRGLYTVAARDNLWKIAEKQLGNGTRYTEIRQLNGLTCNIIRVGMPLILPEK